MAPPPCKPPARASADAPPPTVMRRFVLANQELARHNTKVRPSRPLNTSRLLKHSCIPDATSPSSRARSCAESSPTRGAASTSRTTRGNRRSSSPLCSARSAKRRRARSETSWCDATTRETNARLPRRLQSALSSSVRVTCALSPDPPPRSPRRRASEPPPRRSRSSRSSSTRRLACSAFSARWRPHPRRRPRARARRSNPSRPPEPPPPPPRGHSAFPIARRLRPSPGGSLRRR